ncbi:TPA: tyrosine-type recombinase/integrase [Vibrio parahaemolyticus]
MYESLTKGLAIYRQNHTKSIYVRLRANGMEIKRSLKTSDIDEAKSRAWALKFETEGKITAGIPLYETKELSIKKAFDMVIADLNNKRVQRPTYKDYCYVIQNFIVPYFKRKTISELTTKNIRQYFESLELSETRYNINKTCFTRLLDLLEEEEILKRSDFPRLPKKITTKKADDRNPFAPDDLDIILKELKVFHQSGARNKISIAHKKTLYQYFIFLLETGVRTGEEVFHLKFSDIKKGKENHYIYITKGKTEEYNGNGRRIALSEKALNAIIEIAKIQNPDKKITENNFLNIDRLILENANNKIPCYSTLFGSFKKHLLKKGIEFKNKNYVLYSCRHSFITTRLALGVDIYLVSKYVGSRVETIQEFYDDYRLNNQQHIDQITLRDRNKERWDEYHRIMEEQKKLGVKVDDDMPNFLTEEEEEERIRLQVEAYNLAHPPENDVPPQPPEEW